MSQVRQGDAALVENAARRIERRSDELCICGDGGAEGEETAGEGGRDKKLTKKDLQQIPALNKEIALLKRQIDHAETLVRARQASDVVRGSSKYFPYLERTFSVQGIDWQDYEKQVRRMKRELQRRLDKLMDRIAEAQEYIASIGDSKTRLILQCKYVNGLRWRDIERETGIPERTAQRLHSQWQKFGA